MAGLSFFDLNPTVRLSMERFPLLDYFPGDGIGLLSLTPMHLDKVVNKLQEKSYFRLQQTCRDMNEFIQNSRNISVRVERHLELHYTRTDDLWQLRSDRRDRTRKQVCIDVKSICGVRLSSIQLPAEMKFHRSEFLYNIQELFRYTITEYGHGYFQGLCDLLKNNRITCITAHQSRPKLFPDTTIKYTSLYTTGQELALMKILRPVRSRWYDPRLTSHPREMLPVGTGWYDSPDAVIPLSRFLSVGEEVEFSCTAMEHRYPFLWIHKELSSPPLPMARKFSLEVQGPVWNMEKEDLEKHLIGSTLLTVTRRNASYVMAELKQPQHFLPGSTFYVKIDVCYYSLCYIAGEA